MNRRAQLSARQRGVSLVEALLVALVVALLVAIAVPALLAAMRASREARAVANVRALASSQMTLYATERRFGTFERLFREGFLSAGQFDRVRARGSPSEEVSDGAYRYSFRFDAGAAGLTIDADPEASHRGRARWFRYRLGRTSKAGSEGVLYAAPPSERPPESDDYEIYRP